MRITTVTLLTRNCEVRKSDDRIRSADYWYHRPSFILSFSSRLKKFNNKLNLFSVHSIQGELLLQQALTQGKTVIDFNMFAPGEYLIKATHGDKTGVTRIVRE